MTTLTHLNIRFRPPGHQIVPRLLLAIVLLSLVDLGITLGYMKMIGRIEANGLVRHLAQCSQPITAIILFKLTTTGIAVGVFHRLRHTASGRIGAWLSVGVLVGLTVQWVRYSAFISTLDWSNLGKLAGGPGWVSL